MACMAVQHLDLPGERPTPPPTNKVVETVRRQIFEGTLRPGQLLSQKAIAAELGVSRIPVREALRVLDGEGLVVHEPGVGTRVKLFDKDGLRELYGVRRLLEGTLAEHVVSNVTDDDIDELVRLVEQMDAITDVDRWSDINWEFHSVIHRVARRPTTVRILQHLFAHAEPYSRMFLRHAGHLQLAQSQHHSMIVKIRNGPVEELAAEMSNHIYGALDPLLPVVEDLLRMADAASGDPGDRSKRTGTNVSGKGNH